MDAWGRHWTQHSDEEGDVWYTNAYTGETTWDEPDNVVGTVEYPWETANGEDGDEFYVNTAIVNTRAELEAGEEVEGAEEAMAGVPESQWEEPPGWAHHATLLAANAAASASEGRYEWGRVEDEDGDVYYVHLLTGDSQWEEPPGWEAHLAYVAEHGEGTGLVEVPDDDE